MPRYVPTVLPVRTWSYSTSHLMPSEPFSIVTIRSYACLILLQFVSFCFRLILTLLVVPFVFLLRQWFDSESEIDPVFVSMYDLFPFCSPTLKLFMYPPSLTEVHLHMSPFDSPVLPIKPVVSGSIYLSLNLDFDSCSLHSSLLKLPNIPIQVLSTKESAFTINNGVKQSSPAQLRSDSARTLPNLRS